MHRVEGQSMKANDRALALESHRMVLNHSITIVDSTFGELPRLYTILNRPLDLCQVKYVIDQGVTGFPLNRWESQKITSTIKEVGKTE